MEGTAFPDQDQLLQFLKKLKEVFDACDEDADGYIRVERFVDVGLRFAQGDEQILQEVAEKVSSYISGYKT